MSKRITWKPDQWLAVAQRSFSLLRDPMFNGSKIEAVRQAQRAVLPPELHRGLISMQEVTPKIPELWGKLHDQGYVEDVPVIQPHVNHEIETQHQKTLLLSDITTQDLMLEFMRRITDALDPSNLRNMVRTEVNAVIDRRMPGIIPPDPEAFIPEPEPEKEKLLRVMIIGLNGGQQEIMKRKYAGIIDFHFLEGNEGAQRLKNTAGLMDFSVRSKWCKQNLPSTSGWPNFTATTGGMDTIQRLINVKFKINPDK